MLQKSIASVLVKHAVKWAGNAVGFGIAGDILVEIWEFWNKSQPNLQDKRAEVEALASQPAGTAKQEAKAVVRDVAGDLPEADQIILRTYLTQLPSQTRKSLRRSGDPEGKTVPPDLLVGLETLSTILPPKLPRFKPGDRPSGINWELVELLGAGGFGEVWKARHPSLKSIVPVALKFCLDPKAKRLLQHEAAVVDRVMEQFRQGHLPGIVPLKQAYLESDQPCLEYELVEGGDLQGAVYKHQARATAPLSPDQAMRIVLQLARAVGHAHNLNPPVVHRDLKPANILVRRRQDGMCDFLITDFGIGGIAAKQAIEQTRTADSQLLLTSIAGAYTPMYALPEQIRGEPPDPRDDVHALGVIWYQMLIGDFSDGAPAGNAWKSDLSQRGVSSAALDLLAACFESKAKDRPATAAVVAERIEAIIRLPPPPSVDELIEAGLTSWQAARAAWLNPNGPTNGVYTVTHAGKSAGNLNLLQTLVGPQISIKVASWPVVKNNMADPERRLWSDPVSCIY
jgi:serine/threonine protein kinase